MSFEWQSLWSDYGDYYKFTNMYEELRMRWVILVDWIECVNQFHSCGTFFVFHFFFLPPPPHWLRHSAQDEYGFSCKFDECPEAREPPNPNCAYQFTIDSCCSTNSLCDPKEIEKLPRCWMDGHEFVKGNLIYSPSAPCFKCLCDEKFNNATDLSQNPNCKLVDCGIELHQLNYIQLGCVPVYFDDGLCCPFEFRCRM